jgi:hypothetical protein
MRTSTSSLKIKLPLSLIEPNTMKTNEEVEVQIQAYNYWLWMVSSVQLYAPATLPLRKYTQCHMNRRLGGPLAGVDYVGNR